MLLKQAAVKYRRDGLVSTLSEGVNLLARRKQSVVERLRRRNAIHRGHYTISVGEATAEFHASRGEWGKLYQNVNSERVIYRDILESIQPDDVFWDIGANIGTYTCLIGAALDAGTVVAFEPSPVNAVRIEENARLNDLSPDVQQIALSNRDETLDFALQSAAVGTGLQALSNASEPYAVLSVQARHGDTHITEENLPRPDILKIDVEGLELDVFNGLSETLTESDCRIIYCEAHKHHLPEESTVDDVISLLSGAGYDVTTLQERYPGVHLKATRQT